MSDLKQQSGVYEKGHAPAQYIIHEIVAALTRDVETLFQCIENLHIRVTRLSNELKRENYEKEKIMEKQTE